MRFNPRIWHPIAVVATLANLVAVAFAVNPPDPLHALVHAGLAVVFGVWAQRLKASRQGTGTGSESESEIAVLRDELLTLRQQVGELEERMDFAERMLSQARDMERLPGRPSDL